MRESGIRFQVLPAALALALAFLAGCAGNKGPGPLPRSRPLVESEWTRELSTEQQEPLTDAATMRAAFDVVRHELYGEKSPTDVKALESVESVRAFVCLYEPGAALSKNDPRNLCAESGGANLLTALRAAAKQIRSREPGLAVSKQRKRIKIDIPYRMLRSPFRGDVEVMAGRDFGTIGYWFQRGEEAGWVLPSEVLERKLFTTSNGRSGIKLDRAIRLMRERNPALPAKGLDAVRLFTHAWVESDPAAGRPEILRVYRAHAYEFDEVSEARLLQRITWAADYLISSVTAEGRIRYLYNVTRDTERDSYNLLRHAGTTYSILQAYDRTRFEPYRKAAEAAFEYLFKNCRRDTREGPYGGGETMWIVEGDNVKLGGPGLALVAITQHMESTGDHERYLEQARAFATFIVSQQKKDGEFFSFANLEPGGPPEEGVSEYYPGEAILGLVRLYAFDPNPLWLETAVRGADWLINVRDAGKDERQLANDHWLMIGLSYLYQRTEDPRYVDHSMNLSRAVRYQYERNVPVAAVHPDYRGGYYEPPRSTPAATRGEGLVAVLDTCSLAGTDCEGIEELLHETVRHEMLSQFTPEVMWWPLRPSRAFGGWAGGIVDVYIRNDYVQHNLSSIIGTERHLAAQRGVFLPGGPEGTLRRLGGESFAGLTTDQLAELREPSLRYRGRTLWEE